MEALLFFGGLAAVIVLVVIVQVQVMRRSFDRQAAAIDAEPEIARIDGNEGDELVLRVPASGAFDLVLRLQSRDGRRRQRSFSLEAVSVFVEGTRVDLEGRAHLVRFESLLGSSARAQTDAPRVAAQVESNVQFGADASRSIRLARVTAGSAFELRCRVQGDGRDRLDGIAIVARPA